MSTKIEWTDATWNPVVGCERCSPACDHCYAIRVAAREMQPAHVGLTTREVVLASDGFETFGRRDWTGEIRLFDERLEEPLHWRKPRRCFVCSMSDLFHPDVPREFIQRVWNTMALAPEHTFQVLTKRPQRMAVLCRDRAATPEGVDAGCELGEVPGLQYDGALPNVWLGTSVENQRYADLRIPHLLATPAAVRFLSVEPLLGPVDLSAYLGLEAPLHWAPNAFAPARKPEIDWVIVGGESGLGARPMHPQWVRDIRDQCVAAGVAFFFKQWGEYAPGELLSPHVVVDPQMPGSYHSVMRRVGKKAAGRQLDGREWSEFPE